MARILSHLFLFSCVFFPSLIRAAQDSVPVLIWNKNIEVADSHIHSSVPTPLDTVEQKFTDVFKPKNVVLFLLDQLSVEDFALDPGMKNNLIGYDVSNSVYFPSVECSIPFETRLSSQEYTKHTLNQSSSVGGLKLSEGKNLVIVKLPPTKNSPMRSEAVKKSAEVMQSVIEQLGEKFTYIITGKEPSVKLANQNQIRLRRDASLPDVAVQQDPRLHIGKCVKIFIKKDITVAIPNSEPYKLLKDEGTTAVGDCQTEKDTMKLIYNELGEHQRVSLEFVFAKKPHGWIVDYLVFDTMMDGNVPIVVNLYPMFKMSTIPMKKSYNCDQTLVFKSNKTDGTVVSIPSIQMEAFNEAPSFSINWDCVGFFTIPIFTGLLTGLLLIVILLVGMHMLSDIKTMDRFDDPKGKHFMTLGANE